MFRKPILEVQRPLPQSLLRLCRYNYEEIGICRVRADGELWTFFNNDVTIGPAVAERADGGQPWLSFRRCPFLQSSTDVERSVGKLDGRVKLIQVQRRRNLF